MNEIKTKPVLRWPGNKSRMLARLLPRIKPHVCSVEVFGGSLAWTLAKERSETEVVNDFNGDLIALYRNAQRHLPELERELAHVVSSREMLRLYRTQPGMTEIERAARVLIRSKTSFGGNMDSFAVAKTKGGGAAFNREGVRKQLEAISARLDRVVIENLPWERVLKNYDSPAAFFFMDPPYLHADTKAYAGWTEAQMTEFAWAVFRLKGHYLITVDDSPFNRDLFKRCKMEAVVSKNRLANNRTDADLTFGELIIEKP